MKNDYYGWVFQYRDDSVKGIRKVGGPSKYADDMNWMEWVRNAENTGPSGGGDGEQDGKDGDGKDGDAEMENKSSQ